MTSIVTMDQKKTLVLINSNKAKGNKIIHTQLLEDQQEITDHLPAGYIDGSACYLVHEQNTSEELLNQSNSNL